MRSGGGWNRSGIQERKGMKDEADWAELIMEGRKREEAKIVWAALHQPMMPGPGIA